MKLQIDDSFVPARWDDIVRGLGGTVFHSSLWASYSARVSPHSRPLFITLTSGSGRTLGAALGFVTQSPHWAMRPLTRIWSMDALPLVDGVSLDEFARLLESEARRSGAVELRLDSFASPFGGELQNCGFDLTARFEFELALEPSEEDLWNGLEYKRRKNIKKAARMGVVVRDAAPEEGIPALRRLQASSSERITARGGPDIARRVQPGGDPVQVLLDAQAGKIVVAVVDGEIVSSGLFVCFNGQAYHLLSGHSGRALETQAPTLLLWETIRRLRAEGISRFNFGGTSADALREESPEHGVYLYKLAFGGVRKGCFSGRKLLRPRAAAAAAALQRIRESLHRTAPRPVSGSAAAGQNGASA